MSTPTWLRQLALHLVVPCTLVACGGPEFSDAEVPVTVHEAPQGLATDVTVSFQRGVSPSSSYAGVSDAWLQEGLPSTNAGGDTLLRMDRDYPAASGKSANALLRFDVRAIPVGATVRSVKLTVNVTNRTSGEGFFLYAAGRDWTEAQATWARATSTSTWSTPGARGAADRGTGVLGTLLPAVTGPHTVTFGAAGIAAVQAWVDDPATNRGFVLDANTNMDGLDLASSEAATAAQRPQLTVTYTPGFVHPGLHVSKAQLDFVRAKIGAGAQPWLAQFNKAAGGAYANTAWTPKPVATMRCGNGGSTVNIGCTDSRQDALHAYTLSLLWYHTREQRYADAALRILDAYADTLQTILFIQGDNSTYNGPLQAAWLAELFPRSAEILRYSGAGWTEEKAVRFGDMLKRAVLPRITNGWQGGGSNWNNSMTNGVMNIAVYTNDKALFEQSLGMWRQRVRETYHLASDGAAPISAPDQRNADGSWKSGSLLSSWRGQTEFGTARVNGISMEACRDFGHATMSIASISQAAETALLQGVDLYAEQEARLIASAEFMARFLVPHAPDKNAQLTIPVDSWLCPRRSEAVTKNGQPVPNNTMEMQILPSWEILFNHYVTRKGRSMPSTGALLPRVRAGGSFTDLQISWETLTHAGVGSVGL
ncbi:DNRLRE domain-containing protein [Corallococcus sp. BB11-1]|uniref:DNRLRE domain-containing protein n=1 Tax=Corallococcus sp. BB11-1 TaxID=2996783 RepID=UPI002271B429|nr:DNRLRE domain-containing protein [Corallococcus sp. BB11-1]MCY1032496.1 DNRLRE domain-containing protein [Corallococcus sp. BB11-1]